MSSETDDVMEFFSREDGEVIVTVVKCEDLFDCDQKNAGLFGSMSTDEIDPYVQIRPSWLPEDSSKSASRTKALNGAGRNPQFLEKLKDKATLSFRFKKGQIKDDEPVHLFFTVYDSNMFGGPAFIGECKWTIPNKVFARKTTKDSLPLEFAEKLNIRTKHNKLKKYKKYFKSIEELSKQQLGTVTFQVKFKSGGGNKASGSKGNLTSRSKGSPRRSPRKSGRKKSKEDAKKYADQSPDDILHFIMEELGRHGTNLDEWLSNYDKDADGQMKVSELHDALTAYDHEETKEEEDSEPKVWGLGFEKNDPRFIKLLARFDLHDSTNNPKGKNKMVSIDTIKAVATGKFSQGSGSQNLLTSLREKLGNDLHDAKTAENGEVMKFFESIVEDDAEDTNKEIFERAIDKPDEFLHFKKKIREFLSSSTEMEKQEDWEKRNHIEWPQDYDDLLIAFDTDGDHKILLREFAGVLTKGMKDLVEERKMEAEKEDIRKASLPLPLNDDDLAKPFPGILEVKCVSGEALRDTSSYRDREMDPYVKIKAPWNTQSKSTKPAKNMHTEPRWQESHNNTLSFEVTEKHIADKQCLSEVTVSVHDEKFLAIDPKVGSSTLNIERFVTCLKNCGKWKRLRTELLHTDGSSAGTLNLELRYNAKNCIMQEQDDEDEGKMQELLEDNSKSSEGKNIDENKMLCPGVFAIRVTGGVKEGVKEVTSDANFKLGIIPQWTGRHGLQEPAYPKKRSKKGSQKKHFSFPGASGEEAYNDLIDNIGFKIEIADLSGVPGFRQYKMKYFGIITKKQIFGIKKYKERITKPYKTKDYGDVSGAKKEAEEMTTIQVALTEGSKNTKKSDKKITMTVAIDFQQTSEKPPTEQDVGTSSDALEAELPSTTGILEVEVLESRNVADSDWFAGTSDPYIHLQMVPLTKHINETTKRLEQARTKVYKNAGSTVEINETFMFPIFSSSLPDYNRGKGKVRARAGNLKLKMEMKDKDLVLDNTLGIFALDLRAYLKAGIKNIPMKTGHTHLYKNLKSTDDANAHKTTIWYKAKFRPAAEIIRNVTTEEETQNDVAKAGPEALKRCLSQRTGKCQILVMDAKNLVNVEGILGGKQDPYVQIRIIANDSTDLRRNNANKDHWDETTCKDGAGKAPFWHEWLELPWNDDLKNVDVSDLSALVVVWDKNMITSTLIGAAKIPLLDLLGSHGGNFFDIYAGEKVDDAIAGGKKGGQIRLAALFVPDPKPLEKVKPYPIPSGSFSFYAGSVSYSDIQSSKKNKDTSEDFKLVITDLSKDVDSSIETSTVNARIKGKSMFAFNRKLNGDIKYVVSEKDNVSSKFKIDLVAESSSKSKQIVASTTIPSDVLYSAYKISTICGNPVAKKWLPLISTAEKGQNISIVRSRIELAWIYKDDSKEQESDSSKETEEDALAVFFKSDDKTLKPTCKPGTIKMRVYNATNLIGTELFTKSDPFPTAKIMPDNEIRRFDYPHLDGMPNPIWDWENKPMEHWEFLVEDMTMASIDIQVCNYNESKGTYGDDIMAISTVSVAPLMFDGVSFENLKGAEEMKLPKTAKYPLSRYGKGIFRKALGDNSYVTCEIWFEEENGGTFTHGFIPQKAGVMGRPIDLLKLPSEEMLGMDGVVFCKPIQAMNLTNVDSDGKNDIKVIFEMHLGAGEDEPVTSDETSPADSAGESHEFEKTEMLGLEYKHEYLDIAIKNASTPYVRIKVVDIDEKKGRDTLIGRVDVPLHSLLLNDGAVYVRKLILMDENCSNHRGKMDLMLQFVKDFNGDKKTYLITDEMIKENSRDPIPGTIDFHIKSGRELQSTTIKKGKNGKTHFKSKPLKDIADPYVRLCLTRGGYRSNYNQNDDPDQAIHTTYENQDGGSSPAWDEPPGVLFSHDIELDMLRVAGMFKLLPKKAGQLIGSFDIPLIEFAELENNKKLEGWFPLVYKGHRTTSSLRMSLAYTQSEPEASEEIQVVLSNSAPKGYLSGKGMLDVTVVAARGMKTKKSKGQNYFVRCQVVAADGAINFKKLPGGQFETPVDENVASGDQAIFNYRQKIDISWRREDTNLPVMKFTLMQKRGYSEGQCQVDIAPYIQAPGQPAEFWMQIKEGIDLRLAIRFDDHKCQVNKADTKYFKRAIQGIRNFNSWGSVSVMVVKLRNLKDVGGLIGKLSGDGNDPYVKARLYGAGLGMKGVEDKTRSKSNAGSSARLNETMLFSVDNRQVTPGSVTSLILDVQVYDKDKYSNDDLIGTVSIPVMPFQIFGGHMWEDWFPIKYGKNCELAGEVQLVMQWLPEGLTSGMKFKLGGDKPLWIHIQKAVELKDVTKTFSTDYKMDPFVRVEIVDQGTTVDSDVAVDEGKTPTWDSYFPIDVSDGEAATQIKFSVYDKNGNKETLIGSSLFDLSTEVMEPLPVENLREGESTPFRKDSVEYRVVNEKIILENNGKFAGNLYVRLRREEFEGVTDRDDGQNRGIGDTTIEEDFGEDEDDDGKADGRLHLDVLELKGFEDPKHVIQNSKFKIRVCVNPAKKFRRTKELFKFELDDTSKKWKFDPSHNPTVSGKKRKNPENFQFVLPYMANVGNGGVGLEETNVNLELYIPGTCFSKSTTFAMGKIPWEMLDPLEPRKGEDHFPPKPARQYDIPLNIVKDNETVTLGIATVKATYIPFVAGKVKVSVSRGYSLQLAKFSRPAPRVSMIPIVNGKEIKSEKQDMQPSAPHNGKEAERGNPEWLNSQMTARYSNGHQKEPDYLKLKVSNLPKHFVGEVLIPFYDILRHNVGGKMILDGITLNNEKGTPTNGKIDAEIIFFIDGRAAIAKTTAKEEKQIVKNTQDFLDGKDVEIPPETIQRKQDSVKLMRLREMFYKIDKDKSNTITTDELKIILMETAESNKDISEFLQKAWKAYQKDQNNVNKLDPEKPKVSKDYTVDNVIDMIEGAGGDNTITWDEWVRFAERNIVLQRKIAESRSKVKLSGDGKLARQKKKMDGLIDILGKFDNNEAANRERQLALERTERKKLKAKKKAEEEARQAKLAAQRKEEMDAKRAHEEAMQESKNKERELELKIAKYKEKERLAAEKAAADKRKRLEAQRAAEEKKKRKLERNRIKYVDLPEKQVMHWKPYHVEKWIRTKLELPKYAPRFSEASVDGLLLLSLTENDMKDDELNVDKKLHRAKIYVHIMRLREMVGLPPNENNHHGKTSVADTRGKKSGSVIQIGKSGGAGIAAAPELMRLKLKKFSKQVEAQVQKENAEDKEADAVWPFQYDNPANTELVTAVNMFDFDDDWADQFQEDDPFGREIIDDDDEPPEEAQFRRAMTNVWKKDAEVAKQHGWTVAAEEAFGDDAPGAGKSAKADPYAFIMKFAKDNQLSFYEAIEEPEIKKLNLRLKTGDSIYAQTEAARETRQLPPEFWFKNQVPWWMNIDKKPQVAIGDEDVKRKIRRKRTKIPNLATTEEVLAVVRQAVLEYGRNLESQRKKKIPKEQFEEDMKNRRLKIKKLRALQGLPDMKPMEEEEDRLLADVFVAFSNLQNNETVLHGKSGSWTGFHNKLNRLKLQGAIKVLLKLDMNWQQFDAFFRTLSTNHDGTLQQDEFVAAFRSNGQLSDLVRNDKAGEASRHGGRRLRHNRKLSKDERYHGMGAKKGDEDWRQILDALYAVLRTLEESRINLREAFESFDRNASGEISVAEFASLMKTLGGYGLTKRQIYHLISSMDANFDRTVRFNEFMEFFLVVWVGRLKELRNNLRLHKKGAPDDGTLDYGHQVTENQIKRRLMKAEHAIKATFGSGYMAAARSAGAVLPGAFSALLNKMGLETNAIKSSLMPTDESGKQIVEEAREMTLSPDGRKYKRQFEAELLANKTITAPTKKQFKNSKRVNIRQKNKQIAGKHTLKQMNMSKAQKKLAGELNGPRIKNYGSNGDRLLGMGTRKNILDEFPEDYINPS